MLISSFFFLFLLTPSIDHDVLNYIRRSRVIFKKNSRVIAYVCMSSSPLGFCKWLLCTFFDLVYCLTLGSLGLMIVSLGKVELGVYEVNSYGRVYFS